MRCELPVLSRCCFCFPLRHGLLVWAYLKQIASLILLAIMILKAVDDYKRKNPWDHAFNAIVIPILVAEFASHVFFIISAHKKDYRKIRIFYRYSLVVLILYMVLFFMWIGFMVYYINNFSYLVLYILYTVLLPALIFALLLFFIQGYLVLLVRSEFMKLKNNSQFEFVNNAAEQKCTANFDLVGSIPLTV